MFHEAIQKIKVARFYGPRCRLLVFINSLIQVHVCCSLAQEIFRNPNQGSPGLLFRCTFTKYAVILNITCSYFYARHKTTVFSAIFSQNCLTLHAKGSPGSRPLKYRPTSQSPSAELEVGTSICRCEL